MIGLKVALAADQLSGRSHAFLSLCFSAGVNVLAAPRWPVEKVSQTAALPEQTALLLPSCPPLLETGGQLHLLDAYSTATQSPYHQTSEVQVNEHVFINEQEE